MTELSRAAYTGPGKNGLSWQGLRRTPLCGFARLMESAIFGMMMPLQLRSGSREYENIGQPNPYRARADAGFALVFALGHHQLHHSARALGQKPHTISMISTSAT